MQIQRERKLKQIKARILMTNVSELLLPCIDSFSLISSPSSSCDV